MPNAGHVFPDHRPQAKRLSAMAVDQRQSTIWQTDERGWTGSSTGGGRSNEIRGALLIFVA